MESVLESVKDLDRINTILVEEISDLESKLTHFTNNSSDENNVCYLA